jgi:EAL domain-containing protein (putative c-di-GMP-specific phosphodiesterase class I)
MKKYQFFIPIIALILALIWDVWVEVVIPATLFVAGVITLKIISRRYFDTSLTEYTLSHLKRRFKKVSLRNIFVTTVSLNQLNTVSQYYYYDMPSKILLECLKLLNARFEHVYLLPGNNIVIITEFINKTLVNRKLRYEEQMTFVKQLNSLIENHPFQLQKDGQHLSITPTIGTGSVGFQNTPNTLENLIQLSTYAQELARKKELPYLVASDETILMKEDADNFYKELESGLKLEQFKPHFQPIINPTTRKIVGCESLMRWENRDYRIIEANKFIDIAREKHMMHVLDIQIMKESIKQLSSWIKDDLVESNFKMTINLDIHTILKIHAHELVSICNRYQISPSQIEIDIGDHDIFHNHVNHLLLQLKEIGFHLSLDTSRSPFKALQILTKGLFDSIKFDTSMIFTTNNEKQSIKLFSILFRLAKQLGLSVRVKGLEQNYQLQTLQRLKVDEVQGLYISSPINHIKMRGFLQKYQFYTIS